jgi:hypothetical protein
LTGIFGLVWDIWFWRIGTRIGYFYLYLFSLLIPIVEDLKGYTN